MIVLKCPNCGAALRVSPDKDRARCDHCGSSVLILDAQKGIARLDASSDAAIDEMTKTRVARFVILGIVVVFILAMLSTVISSMITIITSVFTGVLQVILGIVI
jgi:DNA-directed RNA polymerase subunit RPC12/RpoP